MAHSWTTTKLTTIKEVNDLFLSVAGNGWLYRGQSKRYDKLIPSIDRDQYQSLSRIEKINLERKSIDCFRENVNFYAGEGERPSKTSDMIALMVLRHYGVPTRLMDWSASLKKALFFAVAHDHLEDGELWTFNRKLYEEEGAKQWKKYPETTIDGSGDREKFDVNMPTAFTLNEPPDWFVCLFYCGFPRQDAQNGAYSFTPRFNRDHAESIEGLLKDHEQFHLYVISANIKKAIREILKNEHGIWRGPLFPDSAGAADTVNEVIFDT